MQTFATAERRSARRPLAHPAPRAAIRQILHGLEAGRPVERIAEHVATGRVQRSPAVGVVVHGIDRHEGMLDDPSDDGAGNVDWPLSFAVTSPLEAKADVEVTGAPGDPCTDHDIGWLQTVHIHWLKLNYWGQAQGDGSITVPFGVQLPIGDGDDPASIWYHDTAHARPAGCNARVAPHIDDYPTLFQIPKVRLNTRTNRRNYLRGVSRGIHFVTTLVDSNPAGVEPLRFFYWNYQMEIEFTPNPAQPATAWPFAWKQNKANLERAVHVGQDDTVPLFTAPSPRFNASIIPNAPTERA